MIVEPSAFYSPAVAGRREQLLADLAEVCQEIEHIRKQEVPCRLRLGLLLIQIREERHWERIHDGYAGWMDFLKVGFPKLTQMEWRTAYDAINLAECQELAQMPTPELEKIQSLGIARHIAKMKRNGTLITPQVLSQAKTLSTTKFRVAVGASAGYLVRIWFEDPSAGEQAEAILELFLGATPEALQSLLEFLMRPELTAAAPTADDKLDFLLGLGNDELANLATRHTER